MFKDKKLLEEVLREIYSYWQPPDLSEKEFQKTLDEAFDMLVNGTIKEIKD